MSLPINLPESHSGGNEHYVTEAEMEIGNELVKQAFRDFRLCLNRVSIRQILGNMRTTHHCCNNSNTSEATVEVSSSDEDCTCWLFAVDRVLPAWDESIDIVPPEFHHGQRSCQRSVSSNL
jgi:hypothetical protein